MNDSATNITDFYPTLTHSSMYLQVLACGTAVRLLYNKKNQWSDETQMLSHSDLRVMRKCIIRLQYTPLWQSRDFTCLVPMHKDNHISAQSYLDDFLQHFLVGHILFCKL